MGRGGDPPIVRSIKRGGPHGEGLDQATENGPGGHTFAPRMMRFDPEGL